MNNNSIYLQIGLFTNSPSFDTTGLGCLSYILRIFCLLLINWEIKKCPHCIALGVLRWMRHVNGKRDLNLKTALPGNSESSPSTKQNIEYVPIPCTVHNIALTSNGIAGIQNDRGLKHIELSVHILFHAVKNSAYILYVKLFHGWNFFVSRKSKLGNITSGIFLKIGENLNTFCDKPWSFIEIRCGDKSFDYKWTLFSSSFLIIWAPTVTSYLFYTNCVKT